LSWRKERERIMEQRREMFGMRKEERACVYMEKSQGNRLQKRTTNREESRQHDGRGEKEEKQGEEGEEQESNEKDARSGKE